MATDTLLERDLGMLATGEQGSFPYLFRILLRVEQYSKAWSPQLSGAPSLSLSPLISGLLPFSHYAEIGWGMGRLGAGVSGRKLIMWMSIIWALQTPGLTSFTQMLPGSTALCLLSTVLYYDWETPTVQLLEQLLHFPLSHEWMKSWSPFLTSLLWNHVDQRCHLRVSRKIQRLQKYFTIYSLVSDTHTNSFVKALLPSNM